MDNKHLLPSDYVLGDNDVLCGRKRTCSNLVGNQRFQKMVTDCLQYGEAPTKQEKTKIISDIIDRVRERSPMGGFLTYEMFTGCYSKAGDRLAVSAFLS
jgi:hypothetical protein